MKLKKIVGVSATIAEVTPCYHRLDLFPRASKCNKVLLQIVIIHLLPFLEDIAIIKPWFINITGSEISD